MLNLSVIKSAPLVKEPFEFFAVSDVIGEEDLAVIQNDFPAIAKPGIYPLASLRYGKNFARLIEEVQSPALREAIEEKFGVSLAGLPLMITVRGRAQKSDGRIHADSKDKVISCLLYLNGKWDAGGGRLRMLRRRDDINDYEAEISPSGGSFAAFKVTPHSWHGHEPFVGERRYIMFNWLRSEEALKYQIGRHKFSARIKKLLPFFYKGY